MPREINPNANVQTVKITNEEFDQIIGHDTGERKYFTIENNDIIYKRFKEELKMNPYPYLGPCVTFGLGDICIEESDGIFKFYIIDRATKFDEEEFDNVKDAVDKLVSVYRKYETVDNPDKMEEILYEVLGLDKEHKNKK